MEKASCRSELGYLLLRVAIVISVVVVVTAIVYINRSTHTHTI